MNNIPSVAWSLSGVYVESKMRVIAECLDGLELVIFQQCGSNFRQPSAYLFGDAGHVGMIKVNAEEKRIFTVVSRCRLHVECTGRTQDKTGLGLPAKDAGKVERGDSRLQRQQLNSRRRQSMHFQQMWDFYHETSRQYFPVSSQEPMAGGFRVKCCHF